MSYPESRVPGVRRRRLELEAHARVRREPGQQEVAHRGGGCPGSTGHGDPVRILGQTERRFDEHPAGAVRQGDYKLVEFFEDGRIELYNLAGDIGEKNNLLLDEHPYFAKLNHKKAEELHDMLKQWRNDVDARMPTRNPNYRGK